MSKFDIKRLFIDIYQLYLSYRPSFVYRFQLDKGETPFIDKPIFGRWLIVFVLKRYIRRILVRACKPNSENRTSFETIAIDIYGTTGFERLILHPNIEHVRWMFEEDYVASFLITNHVTTFCRFSYPLLPLLHLFALILIPNFGEWVSLFKKTNPPIKVLLTRDSPRGQVTRVQSINFMTWLLLGLGLDLELLALSANVESWPWFAEVWHQGLPHSIA